MKFVESISDIFKCIICHHVLREPVMFVECGHRLCTSCFQQLKQHTAQTPNTQITCPHDRTPVDVDRVVQDKGISRAILDFRVKCSNEVEGCGWVGELRDLDGHLKDGCEFEERNNTRKLVQQLLERVKTCEDELASKAAEVVLLQRRGEESEAKIQTLENAISDHDSQLRNGFLRKAEEVLHLQQRLKLCENDMKKLKEENMQLMENAKMKDEDISNLTGYFKLLEEKIGNEISKIEVDLQENVHCRSGNKEQEEIARKSERNEEMAQLEDRIRSCEIKLENHKMKREVEISNIQERVKYCEEEMSKKTKKRDELKNIQQRLKICEDRLFKTDEEISKLTQEGWLSKNRTSQKRKSRLGSANSSPSTSEFPKLNTKQSKQLQISELEQRIENLAERLPHLSRYDRDIQLLQVHVMNVDSYIPAEYTKFTWRLTNYTNNQTKRIVYSPKFYSEPNGHRCMLSVRWCGDDNQQIGVYLHLCKNRRGEIVRYKHFYMSVRFECTDANGSVRLHELSLEDLRRDLQSGVISADDSGYGTDNFLSAPLLDNHVDNDTLTIVCLLKPINPYETCPRQRQTGNE